jgi:hypothetical protein
MDIITIVLIVVSACILSLGISVVAKSRDNLNKFYFFNILTILGWSLAMIYYRLSNNNTILIWSRLLYVAASLISLSSTLTKLSTSSPCRFRPRRLSSISLRLSGLTRLKLFGSCVSVERPRPSLSGSRGGAACERRRF